jgi:eukaryotic-like serine/threonine-protein kinase
MSHQIACPGCGHKFSLKTVKPGSYKPACTHCNVAFGLVVHPGDPPKLEVRKLAGDVPATRPADTAGPGKSPANKSLLATKADPRTAPRTAPPPTKPTAPRPVSNAPEAAMDSGPTGKSTPPTSPGTGDLDQTMESEAAMRAAPAARSAPQATGPATGLDETAAPSQGATQRAGDPASRPAIDVPARMGGYRILSELGRGGMGAVYLANQISLDRQVALKTIKGAGVGNPRAIARFIREAYAAAQLTHHNVVQIYDLGEEQGTSFFSMELVSGGSLQDLLKKQKRLEPKTAAAMVMQAARGLKFAHDHGMVHRDIKPANLMLTGDGLVKVADLGLVKTPSQIDDEPVTTGDVNPALSSAGVSVTDAGSSMGTPAYMAPEQARDATSVDHRADIYSLGCTFYALLTGRPPFHAKTVKEMMDQHRTAAFPQAHALHADIPEAMDRIIARMTARDAAGRYADLGEAIADLEKCTAVAESRQALASEQNLGRLNAILTSFNSASLLPVRRFGPLALAGLALVLILVLLLMNQLAPASAVVVAAITAPLAANLLAGWTQGASPVGRRLRGLLLGSRWTEWLARGLGAILLAAIVFVLGLGIWWLLAIAIGVAIGAGWHFSVTTALAKQRAAACDQAQKLVRSLRASGIDEPSIRNFFAEYSGKDWEEFFEATFDYDTLREARRELAAAGKAAGRRRFSPWRDQLVDRIEEKLREQKADRDRTTLARAEQAGLQAGGMSLAEARQQAMANAAGLVDAAEEVRAAYAAPAGNVSDPALAKRERIKAMLAAARSGQRQESRSFALRAREALLNQILGGKLRFLLAAGLIAGSVFWMKQNNFLDADYWQKQAVDATQSVQQGGVSAVKNLKLDFFTGDHGHLEVPVVGPLFRSLAPAVVGLFLLASVLASGWRYSVVAIPAALICLLGPSFGIPKLGFPQGDCWLSALAAIALIVVGGLIIRQTGKQGGSK